MRRYWTTNEAKAMIKWAQRHRNQKRRIMCHIVIVVVLLMVLTLPQWASASTLPPSPAADIIIRIPWPPSRPWMPWDGWPLIWKRSIPAGPIA